MQCGLLFLQFFIGKFAGTISICIKRYKVSATQAKFYIVFLTK